MSNNVWSCISSIKNREEKWHRKEILVAVLQTGCVPRALGSVEGSGIKSIQSETLGKLIIFIGK